MQLFKKPELKLSPPTREETNKKLLEINSTEEEIKEVKNGIDYICEDCGYHQGVSWDGKIRKCKSCGGYLKYNPLWERVLELRG